MLGADLVRLLEALHGVDRVVDRVQRAVAHHRSGEPSCGGSALDGVPPVMSRA
jgi:hypothetical protein